MVKIAGVKLRTGGVVQARLPEKEDREYKKNDQVVVSLSDQPETGKIVYVVEAKGKGKASLSNKILRVVNGVDKEKISKLVSEEARAYEICLRKAKKHNLPMKLVASSLSLDGHNLTFYFTAEGRIDFRDLLKDLITTFRKMIRLQQIGPKDAAKLIGGFGPCGRPVCCATFLSSMKSITMDLARDQGMEGVTSSKISGACGKLMCCLEYEAGQYQELRKKLPKVGDEVNTEKGKGRVISLNVLSQKALVKLSDGTRVEKNY